MPYQWAHSFKNATHIQFSRPAVRMCFHRAIKRHAGHPLRMRGFWTKWEYWWAVWSKPRDWNKATGLRWLESRTNPLIPIWGQRSLHEALGYWNGQEGWGSWASQNLLRNSWGFVHILFSYLIIRQIEDLRSKRERKIVELRWGYDVRFRENLHSKRLRLKRNYLVTFKRGLRMQLDLNGLGVDTRVCHKHRLERRVLSIFEIKHNIC